MNSAEMPPAFVPAAEPADRTDRADPTVHLDVTPRWTYPDRRVDAVRGCVAIERGPLVCCFEQADQLGGARLDDLVIQPGGVLGERPVTQDGIGQTIEVTAQGVRLPPAPPAQAAPPQATTSTAPFGPAASFASEVTAIAIPYLQWDNRDGGPMRVRMPQGSADSGGRPPEAPRSWGAPRPPFPPG